ncbi:hypothetical protein F4778DRAFT_780628 [Xylariomycetidae sp. FL2044]|nr:hypothetical protein F4778DRAFT_780628 [Xylariomycetidae sp. FL2044]
MKLWKNVFVNRFTLQFHQAVLNEQAPLRTELFLSTLRFHQAVLDEVEGAYRVHRILPAVDKPYADSAFGAFVVEYCPWAAYEQVRLETRVGPLDDEIKRGSCTCGGTPGGDGTASAPRGFGILLAPVPGWRHLATFAAVYSRSALRLASLDPDEATPKDLITRGGGEVRDLKDG